VESGWRGSWVRGVWAVDGKMMGCGGRDLNRSRGSWVPPWANDLPMLGERSPAGQCACVAGDERSSTGAWPVSERSPNAGRTFASSVSAALLRALRRTIAQRWANVRFISVFSTFWRTSANDRSVMGERSLP
jgi:hypothetical protein